MHKGILIAAAALTIVAGVSVFSSDRATAAGVPADLRAAAGASAVDKVWCRRWCGPRGCFRRCGYWRRRW
ncbi:MAG: hypothetical protein ABW200_13590 [Hyphomicrobiaceae bacterium]|jgi:hypothetical protein